MKMTVFLSPCAKTVWTVPSGLQNSLKQKNFIQWFVLRQSSGTIFKSRIQKICSSILNIPIVRFPVPRSSALHWKLNNVISRGCLPFMSIWKPLKRGVISICGKNPIFSLILLNRILWFIRSVGAKEAKNLTGNPPRQKLKAGVFLSALNCSPQKNSQLAGVDNCGLQISDRFSEKVVNCGKFSLEQTFWEFFEVQVWSFQLILHRTADSWFLQF